MGKSICQSDDRGTVVVRNGLTSFSSENSLSLDGAGGKLPIPAYFTFPAFTGVTVYLDGNYHSVWRLVQESTAALESRKSPGGDWRM